ncbi:MAG: anthranilate synthase component 1, partial [Gammaproteobacteria bacterium]|nr:anthranilate synthase component 1 [Gammaproteobacteria bacterium]
QFSIFEPLRQTQKLLRSGDPEHDAVTFLFGYFAYDLVDQFEQIPAAAAGDKSIPDYVYYLADQLLIRDEQHASAKLFTLAFDRNANNLSLNTELNTLVDKLEALQNNAAEDLPQVELHAGIEQFATSNADEFKQGIDVIREHIKAGDVFQSVLSRQFKVPCDDAFAAYQVLKRHNPSPYMFFLQGREFALFGASPESAVKFSASDREVTIYPIAGTHKRGTDAQGHIDPDLDSRIEASLKQNAKELAEHMMLVDLARNDIARVCKPGTRQVRELLQIVRYAHVMHLVSEVIGELQEGLDALHAYQACHNMGTLVGAPKIKATSILRGLEPNYRGTYGGAVGYLNAAGDMDTAIIIRSALVKDGVGIVQTGAGIVLDSDPDSEVQETCNKAAAAIRACLAVSDNVSDNVSGKDSGKNRQRSKASWLKW